MADVKVGLTFGTFEEAKTAIESFCKQQHFPINATRSGEIMQSMDRQTDTQTKPTAIPLGYAVGNKCLWFCTNTT